MDLLEKLTILGDGAREEEETPCGLGGDSARERSVPGVSGCIYLAKKEGGGLCRLFKVLLTNACMYDCAYCAVRASADNPLVRLSPEEMARTFMDLWNADRVDGLFLSSGIAVDATRTQEGIVKTAEILRLRYQFRGYIHLKIMPGAPFDLVEAAVTLSDRVSLNLEAPSPERLLRIAQKKEFYEQMMTRMRHIRALGDRGIIPRSGLTTQFVVGAADESDAEILDTTSHLYQEIGLRRAYFSPFRPPSGSPLADHPATPFQRKVRLYEADFLLRHYSFAPQELIYDPAGNLPLTADPKLVWAQAHPEVFPVEINRADRHTLLRVPGIGPRSADRILAQRQRQPFKTLDDLRVIGVVGRRAAGYVLLHGRRPEEAPVQLSFWPGLTISPSLSSPAPEPAAAHRPPPD